MEQRTKQNNSKHLHDVTVDDVRRVLDIGRLLATALTASELHELLAENGGMTAKRDETGTGFANTHRSRHLPVTEPS